MRFICLFFLFSLNAKAGWVENKYKNASKIEQILQNEPIVKTQKMVDYLEQNNQNADFDGADKVFVAFFKNGIKGVFKINDKDAKDIYSAVLAYKIAQKTNLAYTPPVVIRKVNNKLGSLQLFEESAKIISNDYEIYKVDKKSFEELAIFYFLARQWDTGIHNFLFEEHDNITYPISIDNDNMFNQQKAKYAEYFYMARCYCEAKKLNTKKETTIDKGNIENIKKICKNCYFLNRFNHTDKMFYKQNMIFSDLQYGMRIYPKKCRKDTINKINAIDKKFLEDVFDKKITQRNAIINDILNRKQQILDNCKIS